MGPVPHQLKTSSRLDAGVFPHNDMMKILILTCNNAEFKEIRKEWKARKKEEEQARKAAEEAERQRQAAQAAAHAQNGAPGPEGADGAQPPQPYSAGGRQVQLPPIGYSPASYPAPPSTGVPHVAEYSPTSSMYSANYQPASPYAPQSQQMYNQRQ